MNTLPTLTRVLQIRYRSRSFGLSQCSSECLLATLNCSSIGGEPIVAQNKQPRSIAETIVIATSLKLIGLNAPLIFLVSLSFRRGASRSTYHLTAF